MFGLVYTGNNTFCPSCSDTLVKTDLNGGWFKSFLGDERMM